MIDEKDIAYLDRIYKRKDDCDNDMNKNVDLIHKLDTEITELSTQLKSIKWLITTAIGCIIAIIIQNFFGG
jgi:hypothetical protein